MYDICAIGDILIDYVPAADYRPDAPVYQMKTGGTMVNLAAASAKLGMNTLFVGKVGRDFMGRFILDELAGLGGDVRHCPEDPVHPTTQAFVSLSADGERSFSFARRFGADIFLDKEDLPMGQTLSSAMLCFSGMCLTDEPIKSSVRYAVSKAAERGVPIAFDLNYRPGLWRHEASVKKAVAPLLPLIDIYKSSDDELYLVTGEKDFKAAAKKLAAYGCRLIVSTKGNHGAEYYYLGHTGRAPAFNVPVVDTTGAGDCFFAALLYQVNLSGGLESLEAAHLDRMIAFANAAGSLATTKKGGVASAPALAEIGRCLTDYNTIDFY